VFFFITSTILSSAPRRAALQEIAIGMLTLACPVPTLSWKENNKKLKEKY
jgi:hypothetical protein